MRILLLVCGLSLGVAPSAFAQTHPCDLTAPTAYQVRRADVIRAGFCYPSQEDDGTPIPLGETRFRLMVAGTPTLYRDLGLLAPATGPNAAGLYYYESSTFTVPADVALAVTAEWNGVLASSPIISIDVRGGPKAPSGLRVVISQG
jgi:hypothetical protein